MKHVAPSPLDPDWKVGILADGLTYVHAETDDPALASWLLAYADALTAASPRPTDLRYYPALAYVAYLEGRSAHREAALAALASPRLGYWGKPLAALCARQGDTVQRRPSRAALCRGRAPDRAGAPAIAGGRGALFAARALRTAVRPASPGSAARAAPPAGRRRRRARAAR